MYIMSKYGQIIACFFPVYFLFSKVYGIWFDSLISFLSIGMVIMKSKHRYLILCDPIRYPMPEGGEPSFFFINYIIKFSKTTNEL